jgi:uncharacterized membrane protein YbhN (UPF0104 family)
MSGLSDEFSDEPALPSASPPKRNWKLLEEFGKYSAVLVVMVIACYMLKQKLDKFTLEQIIAGITAIPPQRMLLAGLLTVLNYFILTGYDFIAVKYLKKNLTVPQVMTGAVVGYALSNIFGWIFGGTASRYRLYSSWGFSLKEIVAFVSILSMTFWLGMFLLAGLAFVALPVQLPAWVNEELPLSLPTMGWLFLLVVGLYLMACAFWRKPIRWGEDTFALPPLYLSTCQLIVSACDFALASAVLFVLMPPELTNFSTVLVTYLAAMIVVVTVHVPGGIGILENITLELLTPNKHPQEKDLIAALVMYRVIYYFAPAIVAGGLLLWNEILIRSRGKHSVTTNDAESVIELETENANSR